MKTLKIVIAAAIALSSFAAYADYSEEAAVAATEIKALFVSSRPDAPALADEYIGYLNKSIDEEIANGTPCITATRLYATAGIRAAQQSDKPEGKKFLRALVEPSKKYVTAQCMATLY
jgi:hypothetical protein